MPVIKRYPNRKLYDTEGKRYITLEGIADLIRRGAEVQVVDHKTNEDLTAVTLTQIIFEQEKKRGGFLPKSVLTGLVQAGGDTMNALRRSLTSPLDLLRHVDEEIERRLQDLISRGELANEEGRRLREKLLNRSYHSPLTATQDLKQFLQKKGVPTRDELEQLNAQLDALNEKLERLIQTEESNQA
ncbi:MAG: polyhydroxyalkanoate synthesis regulator DNA-binding domain-containing protein [Anaerolineae bacterium]